MRQATIFAAFCPASNAINRLKKPDCAPLFHFAPVFSNQNDPTHSAAIKLFFLCKFYALKKHLYEAISENMLTCLRKQEEISFKISC